MKKIYLPNPIRYDFKNLGPSKKYLDIKNQMFKIDRQIFCAELLKFFNENSNTLNFNMHIDKSIEKGFSNENIYEPITVTKFSLDIKNIEYKNKEVEVEEDVRDSLIKVLKEIINWESSFKVFKEYVSSENKEKIFWWLYLQSKNNDIFSEVSEDNMKFVFHINKDFAYILAQEAYGDDYSAFLSEMLESSVDKASQNKAKKLKI